MVLRTCKYIRTKDLDAFLKALAEDPYYMETIRPDELKFIEPEKLVLTVGYDVAILAEGKVVQREAGISVS